MNKANVKVKDNTGNIKENFNITYSSPIDLKEKFDMYKKTYPEHCIIINTYSFILSNEFISAN